MAYNPNFQWKRKTVTISVPTSSLPTGYQVKLIIPKETEMQSDFRDLRFETTDGYGLSHWLESIVSNTATVWVKLKNVVNAPTAIDIYMYYGNPYVSSTSNGNNTFDLFDDFTGTNGAIPDTTKWTRNVTGSGVADIQNNTLRTYIPSSNNGFVNSINNISPPCIIELSAKASTTWGSNDPWFGLNDIGVIFGTSNVFWIGYYGGTWTTWSGYSLDIWYKFRFKYTSTTFTVEEDVRSNTYTQTITIPATLFKFGDNMPHAGGKTGYMDDFRIRKYVATEPATPAIGGTATNVNWNPQRKAITINTTTATPANYQVRLTIPFAPEMNIDFSDLRFVSNTNVPLDYWIESSTPGVTADVWVELANAINASSSDYIYMHYGNPNLTSTSNGTNTFILFDDFNDGNQSGWTNVAGTWTESNGIRSQTLATAGANKYSYKTMGADTSYIASVKFRSASFGIDGHIGLAIEASASNAYGTTNSNTNPTTRSNTFSEGAGWGTSVSTGITLQTNTWYRIDGQRTTNSQKVRIYPVGSIPPVWQASNTYTSLPNPPRIGLFGGWSDATVDFDDFYVRKYITTEPSFSIGSAESMNSFSYRKTLTINNGSGGVLTDYQIPITVTYVSTHMQSNFNDIRFVDTNGNLLPYWIESKTDSSTAYVWIKVNLSTGNNTVYMYYGNSSITSASNGVNVFINSADVGFDSEVGWNRIGDVSTVITNSKMSYNFVNQQGGIYSNVSLSSDFIYDFTWVKSTAAGSNVNIGLYDFNTNQVYNYQNAIYLVDDTSLSLYTIIGGSYTGVFTTALDIGTYYCTIKRIGNTVYLNIYSDTTRTTSIRNLSGSVTGIGTLKYAFAIRSHHTLPRTSVGSIDSAYIRKYTSSAPTYTTGAEEQSTGTLDISSTPSGAEIFIDTVDQLVTTPRVITGLIPDSHIYKLTKLGYVDSTDTFSITSGSTTTISVTMVTPANITATNLTITPSTTPCISGSCTVTVSVTWTNNGGTSGSIVPNITIDTVPISPAPYLSESLAPSANVTKIFIIYNLTTGTHNICPSPN